MTTTNDQSHTKSSVGAGEAARRLGVHVGTIRRWADAGKLASWRTPGGYRRFEVADLEQLKAQAVKA